ncbi:MAG: metallopeptidase family protein [Streptosporangiales bacterium]|nr:metallopeptidase family protein [Streptosporangiales bacterium]MBO0890653.1 metallopeptidase family protein [Acidothermales bacterium]
MVKLTPAEFELLVQDALDGIPDELGAMMNNVAVVVEDDPPQPGLLGLYQGVPLTQRGQWYAGVLPDRISIYRNTICAVCETPEEVEREVRVTVVHEVAHHFGIDDGRLHELGWA